MGIPWPPTQQNVSRWVLGFVLTLFVCIVVLATQAVTKTKSGVLAAASSRWGQANSDFTDAASNLNFFSNSTFHRIHDLEFWRNGLLVAKHLSLHQMQMAKVLPAEPVLLSDELAFVLRKTQILVELWPKTVLVQRMVNAKLSAAEKTSLDTFIEWLQNHPQAYSQAVNSFDFWRHGQHKILVLLQNSDELRPTGGFMGSYAVIEFVDGKLAPISITDIYAPAGQLVGYVPAPPGVKEYLSSGQGWGLPDANWSPDFPTSARDIQLFMTKAKQPEFDAIVAINLRLFESILDFTGPIALPDQKMTITSQNISQLARADRSQFFAGSYQKPQLLHSLATQLKLKLADLSLDQKIELLGMLIEQAQQKNIQVFAKDLDSQQLSQTLALTGELPQTQPVGELQLAIVEANVGINKVNRFIQREYTFQQQEPNQILAQLTFTNTTTDQDYVQYLRLISSSSVAMSEVSINTTPASRPDVIPLLTSSGKSFSQTGFLVSVPRGKTVTVQATLTDSAPITFQKLWLWKQAGIAPTPVHIISGSTSQKALLRVDQSFSLGNSP